MTPDKFKELAEWHRSQAEKIAADRVFTEPFGKPEERTWFPESPEAQFHRDAAALLSALAEAERVPIYRRSIDEEVRSRWYFGKPDEPLGELKYEYATALIIPSEKQ